MCSCPTFSKAVRRQRRSRCGWLFQGTHFQKVVSGGQVSGRKRPRENRKCMKRRRYVFGIRFQVTRVHFDKGLSVVTRMPGSHLTGCFFCCVTLAHILQKRLHQWFLPGRKTGCGTQDRAGPRFCNLGPILCPKSKEQLVLRRLSVVLYGCPSA